MLGIDDEHVLREAGPGELDPETSADVEFRYNHTHPSLLRDGVDVVAVSREADDRFRVEYSGYLSGVLDVTRVGVEQLAATLVGDRDAVPTWVVASGHEWLPDWLPDAYSPPSPVTCEDCGDQVPATGVLMPTLADGDSKRICRDCWER